MSDLHIPENPNDKNTCTIPEWQIKPGLADLKKTEEGTAGLQTWKSIKKEFGL